MFNGATSFNQSLCAWGSKLPSGADMWKMFEDSACEDPNDPMTTIRSWDPFVRLVKLALLFEGERELTVN
jgi:hypothetical protein